MGFFSKGLKNEFETASVNEPSGFEPLKFYCMPICLQVTKATGFMRVKNLTNHADSDLNR